MLLDATATAAANAIACTFTNTRLPTITLTKISNGDVGPFTFNGTNGFGAAQTITTLIGGGVAGSNADPGCGVDFNRHHRNRACRLQPGLGHVQRHGRRHGHTCRQTC